jgi:glycine/D-amino acid oxidase-like deaminating enzyme
LSLWGATAKVGAPDTLPLAGEVKADVAILGAGYTGLAAALALAENGARVVVIEAETPGFGASGRNGGQVIPGLKLDPDALDRTFGEATTAFVGAAADTTFGLIDRLGLDCGAARTGWIQGSIKRAHVPALAARAEQWRRRGAPVCALDGAEMASLTGSPRFVGGWRDGRAGVLHPLDYARGLARAAQSAGAAIHGNTRALRLTRAASGWRVTTAKGAVAAGQVLLATNGYSDGLWPGLAATVLPTRSCQIATEPLPETALARVLPGGEAVSDTRRIGVYFRRGPGGRLLIGGRGPFREPGAPQDYARLIRALGWLYPALADVKIEHYWSGRVAMTPDHLPHVHDLAPGVTAALGYNGRGVALATSLGLALARSLIEGAKPPLAPSPTRPLPMHGWHPLYGEAAISYYRLRDALEI